VGLGRIGRALAARALAFSARVIYADTLRRTREEEELGVEFCSFERLLAESDHVILAVALNDQTRHLIDERALARMKPDSESREHKSWACGRH